CLQRRERGCGRGVPGRTPAVPRHRRGRRRRARACRRVAGTRRRRSPRSRPARPHTRRRGVAGRMIWLVVVVGLLLLVFLHELGHFTVALAVGIRPRSFYVGFPPAVAKIRRKGIEYGIGAIPLGGYVRIPGMHRPASRDFDAWIRPALQELPALTPAAQRV